MTLEELYERLKHEGKKIAIDAQAGNEKAKHLIEMYQFHYRCPSDPGGQVFLVEAYNEYKKSCSE